MANESTSEITERLADVFRATFGDESLVLRPEMTADDVAGWDSVTHITLIYAVEDEFGIKFSARDIEKLSCVGDMIATIERRL